MSVYHRTTLLLVILLLCIVWSAPVQAAGCEEIAHHQPSVYLAQMLGNPAAKLWSNPATGDMFIAMRIADCAGRWLVAIYRGGKFTTHFFPKVGLPIWTAWDYIVRQVAAAGAQATSWSRVRLSGFFFIVVPCDAWGPNTCEQRN